MNSAVAAARPDLDAWLRWQESLHPESMDLGLERVRTVAQRLDVLPPASSANIVIAGTNGKGSCALMLEALLGADQTTGVYTSPHLLRYNERVRIGHAPVSSALLCDAFAAVEAERGQQPLTYFEFGTLAAFWLFRQAALEMAILEVGLGGRLDAVNLVDADIALITNIGLDHRDWLGPDREAIGGEKAGIMRAGKPVVIADRQPPDSLLAQAKRMGAPAYVIGRDFDLETDTLGWHWRDWYGRAWRLPAQPDILPDNLAAVLAVATLHGLQLTASQVAARLAGLQLPGRRQYLAGHPAYVFDVGHNAEAMTVLGQWLQAHPIAGRTHLLIAMLRDKPAEAASAKLLPHADRVYAAGLDTAGRGQTGAQLAVRLAAKADSFPDVAQALRAAQKQAQAADRIVVCGSFHTVCAAMQALDRD